MKIKKLLIFSFSFLLVCLIATLGVTLTYLKDVGEISSGTQIGKVSVISVSNPTTSNKIDFVAGQNIEVPISINLDCNVDAVLRVKIAARYFDKNDRLIYLANNLTYNLNTSQGTYTSDGFDLCFYFNGSIKDITTLNFLTSVTCGDDPSNEYSDVSIDFVIEVDTLQMKGIDYDNHPWKDNAPVEWINLIKNL